MDRKYERTCADCESGIRLGDGDYHIPNLDKCKKDKCRYYRDFYAGNIVIEVEHPDEPGFFGDFSVEEITDPGFLDCGVPMHPDEFNLEEFDRYLKLEKHSISKD